MEEKYRGTGRTTNALISASKVNGNVAYVLRVREEERLAAKLAEKIGIAVVIKSLRFVIDNHVTLYCLHDDLRGIKFDAVFIDHDAYRNKSENLDRWIETAMLCA